MSWFVIISPYPNRHRTWGWRSPSTFPDGILLNSIYLDSNALWLLPREETCHSDIWVVSRTRALKKRLKKKRQPFQVFRWLENTNYHFFGKKTMLNKYSHLSDCLFMCCPFFPEKKGKKNIQAINKGDSKSSFHINVMLNAVLIWFVSKRQIRFIIHLLCKDRQAMWRLAMVGEARMATSICLQKGDSGMDERRWLKGGIMVNL